MWGRKKKRNTWGQIAPSAAPEERWITTRDDSLRIVSAELWNAAQAAVKTRRAAYHRDGRPGGRLPGGLQSPYLLSSLAECAQCGGNMVSATRDLKSRGRKRVYVCGRHRERGNAVCSNALPVSMDRADEAVLDAVERDLLSPRVVTAAIEKALKRSIPSAPGRSGRGEVERQLATIDQELTHYAQAIASAGPLDSILAEIKERETRKAALKAELSSLVSTDRVGPLDRVKLKAEVTSRLNQWRTMIRRKENVAEARTLLARLLGNKRLRFEPVQDADGRRYAFSGDAALSGFFEGTLPGKRPDWSVTPAGFEPAISTLKGSRPWPG